MGRRIVVTPEQLVPILMGWLRKAPPWIWGKRPAYERLRAQKRHDANNEPDPKREAATIIADRIGQLGWEVSYDERENVFGDRKGP
jgi:hypothetical protein